MSTHSNCYYSWTNRTGTPHEQYIYNKHGYLHYHGYTSYQFYCCCCGTFINIVTLITKFTKFPYGYCGTLLPSLLWLIKLPTFIMVSTVPFGAMVIVVTMVTFVPWLLWLRRCV